jgi:mRNA (guanine-N7-)-methyltransferase
MTLRRMAAQYRLYPVFKKEFHEVFEENREHRDFKQLMVRMNVCDATGASSMEDEEWEAVSKYFFGAICNDANRIP